MLNKEAPKEEVPVSTSVSTGTILIKGALLVFLAMSGNFLAELLGCKTQKLLAENMWAKHIILIFSIYFAVGFTTNLNPVTNMRDTLVIWLIFLLFTKLSVAFTGIIFICLAGLYITQNFLDYYKVQSALSKKTLDLIVKVKNMFTIGLIIILIIGFTLYSRQQFLDHRDDFSAIKLLFGTISCDHQDLQNLTV
tara:strand:- start:274 stop:855 length:582 start_codon:yes stop_codon:yes gene_type:complete